MLNINYHRGIEQLVARRAHNPEVVGSNPAPATTRPYGQAVKTSPFHGGNPGSSPGRVIHGSLAQLGEHLPYKQGVIGSSPIASTLTTLV